MKKAGKIKPGDRIGDSVVERVEHGPADVEANGRTYRIEPGQVCVLYEPSDDQLDVAVARTERTKATLARAIESRSAEIVRLVVENYDRLDARRFKALFDEAVREIRRAQDAPGDVAPQRTVSVFSIEDEIGV